MTPLLDPTRSPRLAFLGRTLSVAIPMHLVWEIAQLPLYTLWETGTPRVMATSVLHCTGGDVLIALGSLGLAIIGFGRANWPVRGNLRVAVGAIVFGVAYTIFSEWLNTEIRGAWAYRTLMPVVPPFGTGLSPLLQWIVVPGFALWWAQRGIAPPIPHGPAAKPAR